MATAVGVACYKVFQTPAFNHPDTLPIDFEERCSHPDGVQSGKRLDSFALDAWYITVRCPRLVLYAWSILKVRLYRFPAVIFSFTQHYIRSIRHSTTCIRFFTSHKLCLVSTSLLLFLKLISHHTWLNAM